jgi:hypothetical protein
MQVCGIYISKKLLPVPYIYAHVHRKAEYYYKEIRLWFYGLRNGAVHSPLELKYI